MHPLTQAHILRNHSLLWNPQVSELNLQAARAKLAQEQNQLERICAAQNRIRDDFESLIKQKRKLEQHISALKSSAEGSETLLKALHVDHNAWVTAGIHVYGYNV